MHRELLTALLCATVCGAQPAPVIAHWPLDELVQGTTVDAGPNHLDADLTGGPTPKAVEGRVGSALRFAEGDAALTVPAHDTLDLDLPFTIALWMRPEKRDMAMDLLCRATDSGPDGWRLRTGLGQVTLEMRTPDGQVRVGVADRTMPDDQWVHVAVTADGQMLRLYVNAEMVTETPCKEAPVPNQRELVISNYVGNKDVYPYMGDLDDIWLLGASLNAEEIYRLAQGTEPMP